MGKYKILVSESYHRDIRSIINYITNDIDAPFAAADFLDYIEKIISSLSHMPYRYNLVDDTYLHNKKFRKCIIKNYIIFYNVDESSKTVMIHRILHIRQNWIDYL